MSEIYTEDELIELEIRDTVERRLQDKLRGRRLGDSEYRIVLDALAHEAAQLEEDEVLTDEDFDGVWESYIGATKSEHNMDRQSGRAEYMNERMRDMQPDPESHYKDEFDLDDQQQRADYMTAKLAGHIIDDA